MIIAKRRTNLAIGKTFRDARIITNDLSFNLDLLPDHYLNLQITTLGRRKNHRIEAVRGLGMNLDELSLYFTTDSVPILVRHRIEDIGMKKIDDIRVIIHHTIIPKRIRNDVHVPGHVAKSISRKMLLKLGLEPDVFLF